MGKILISLVITTYNRATLLAEALESVAQSEVEDPTCVEVIVVDNNSTDRTHETVKRIQGGHFPFALRYTLERNQGLSYARNRGVDESTGVYVAFMDDDQLLDRNYLSRLAPAFKSTLAICLGGPLYLNNRAPAPKWLPSWLHDVGELNIGDEIKVLDGSERKKLIGGNMAFVRQELVGIGKYDIGLGRRGGSLLAGEEFELQYRLHTAGKKVVYHPDLVQLHNFTLASRTKRYWRKYFFDRGRSRYRRRLIEGNIKSGPMFFGAQRWLWAHLIMKDVPRAMRSLTSLHPAEVFDKQLSIWERLGEIYEARAQSVSGKIR